MAAKLSLTREGVGIELRRGRFEVVVDGESLGSIERHETVEKSLDPEDHTLPIRAGGYSSNQLSFATTEGETARFHYHGAMVSPRYLASSIKPDLAISLKRE